MTVQQNIDYRVSVMDKVGVKITDADGTQRPITAQDLDISNTSELLTPCVWIVVQQFANYDDTKIKGVFSNERAAEAFANKLGDRYLHDSSFPDYQWHQVWMEKLRDE